MFSSPAAGKSVDSLTALSPSGRQEIPLHSARHGQGHGRPISRRGSTASSIHSIGGVLDSSSSSRAKSVYESGQNAISTLLQPPIVRTGLQPHMTAPASSSHKPPTAKDIPPVTLTNIPIVDASEFNPYLSQVGALYEQLRRVKESDEDAANIRRSSRQDEGVETGSDGLLRPSGKHPRRTSVSSVTSVGSLETSTPSRRGSSGFVRRGQQGPAPLSTIPTVYFDDDFHLENPRTFDVVSERSEIIRPTTTEKDDGTMASPAPRKSLATNAILQEKLSWYMDTIEVHLINSISTASTTFFTALGSLKELHSEAASSVERISALRQELKALDEEVATNGILIAQKRQRQQNLRQLSDAVSQLRKVMDGVAACESLVDAGDVDKALANIFTLEKLIAGERDQTDSGQTSDIQLRDLRETSALRGVANDMTTLRFRIGKAYDAQFSSVLLADLRRHVDTVSSAEVLQRWSNSASRSRGGHSRSPSVFPTYLTATDELKTQLMPSMIGLCRAKHVATAAMAYRDAALREIRNLIRRPLPSSSDDDNESMMSVSTASGSRHKSSQEKSVNLARNLRALDAEDAEELLVKIYLGVTETLRRLTTQVKVLLDIASCLSKESPGGELKSPPVRSPVTSPRPDRFAGNPMAGGMELQEELHKAIDINNLLTQAVGIANDKIVKVLKVRSEQSTRLPLDLFLRYFMLNLYFANECEAISGFSGTSLKNVVNAQIKDFVEWNRDTEMQKLAQGMESDQWNAKDFGEANSELLDLILGAVTQDPAAWTESTKLWIPYREVEADQSKDTPSESNGTSVKDKTRPAIIDSEKFVLPNSALLCLGGIVHFMRFIAGIPSMTTEVASSLISYLQLFNSRCTQLILGAGAMKTAGLKNITTKHLALTSQALAFIATLVPHIREFVRSRTGSGPGVSSLMGEFDKVRRLLQEHQDSIHQKLVDIMGGRATVHAKSMRAINWDTSKADGPHPYMETLVRETTTLHRVLTKHLPESSIRVIMAPVFARYKDQLGEPLREANPETEAGLKSMLQDVELFTTKLGKLEGFDDAGDFLAGIVKAKEIKPETPEKDTPVPESDQDATNGGEPANDETDTAGDGTVHDDAKETKDDGPGHDDGREAKDDEGTNEAPKAPPAESEDVAENDDAKEGSEESPKPTNTSSSAKES